MAPRRPRGNCLHQVDIIGKYLDCFTRYTLLLPEKNKRITQSCIDTTLGVVAGVRNVTPKTPLILFDSNCRSVEATPTAKQGHAQSIIGYLLVIGFLLLAIGHRYVCRAGAVDGPEEGAGCRLNR